MRMHHIVICYLPGSAIFFYIFPQTAHFRVKKKFLNIKCVFSTTSIWNIPRTQKTIAIW
jgi:hypothetical protein